MSKKDLQNSNFVAREAETIADALKYITQNRRGCVAIVDDKFIFKGVVSDGDIRRGMLEGATKMTPLSQVINVSPIVLREKEADSGKGEEIFKTNSAINVLPVLGDTNILADVLIRNPEK